MIHQKRQEKEAKTAAKKHAAYIEKLETQEEKVAANAKYEADKAEK